MLPAACPRRLVSQVVVFFRQREQPTSVAHIRCRRCEFDRFGCVRSRRTIHMIEFPKLKMTETFMDCFGNFERSSRGCGNEAAARFARIGTASLTVFLFSRLRLLH